ncbi:MAG: hypothetical protein H7Z71_09195 [Moraxellaceae bacterium]|nr:hypothetical protein [Pseudobdellovibrionaceae bacterium]
MLFSVPQSRADILFIDLNHSEAEYQTILKEARKKNEKVIRLPVADELKIKTRKEAEAEVARIQKLSPAQQRKNYDRLLELDSIVQNNKPDLWTYEEYKKAIALHHQQGLKVNTLIISGHHANDSEYEYYGGAYGNFDKNFLFSLQREFPGSLDKIEHLLLMGCYSYTTKDKGAWNYLTNQSVTVIGFDTPAPLGCSPLSSQILQKGLAGRDVLKKVQNETEILEFINEINSLPLGCGLTVSSGKNYASSRRSKKNSAPMRACDASMFEEVKQGFAMLNDYMQGKKPGANPDLVAAEKFKMRQAYTLLQQNYDCKLLKPYFQDMMKIPFMLHSSELRTNAQVKYADLIKLMNEELKKQGFSPIPDLNDPLMTQSLLIFHINRLETISKKLALPKSSLNPLAQLNKLQRNLKALLVDLSVRDFSWAMPEVDASELPDPVSR